ncbi:alpha/beta fold hydrolase [Streptomyces sp. T-3]|nr:alpha/beta fold hydrolase [Streptomyces sp. T-3]
MSVRPARRLLRHATVALLTACTLVAVPAAVAAEPPAARPAGSDPVDDAKKLATQNLPGVNDWSCKPSAEHPRPLILVHGTFDAGRVWAKTAPDYKKAGYCVFALDYGKSSGLLSLVVGGIDRIAVSALELADFVDGVLEATGTKKVDIVGHSQGGMLPRYYMQFAGGADKVHTLVGISPSSHGTGRSDFMSALFADAPDLRALFDAFAEMVPIGKFVDIPCPACTDQVANSPFQKRMNKAPDTLPGVNYTTIVTNKDSVITPWKSQYLEGPNVKNYLLQDVCKDNFAQHNNSVSDPVATRLALNALDPEHAVKPTCPTLASSILGLLGG